MTKTIKRLLPAALAVLLAGCAMQPVDSTTTRYRVALVAKNNRDSEFWDAVFTGAEAVRLTEEHGRVHIRQVRLR